MAATPQAGAPAPQTSPPLSPQSSPQSSPQTSAQTSTATPQKTANDAQRTAPSTLTNAASRTNRAQPYAREPGEFPGPDRRVSPPTVKIAPVPRPTSPLIGRAIELDRLLRGLDD